MFKKWGLRSNKSHTPVIQKIGAWENSIKYRKRVYEMKIKRTIKFMKLDPEAILEVFKKHQVTFPRSLRIKVLSESIESK